MKKKFCLFLCLILCFSIMPSGEAKTEQAFFFGGDFEFVLLEDGTAQITKHLRLTDILTIPNELDGHIVTAIGDNAFCTCNDLVSVMLPNSIKSIGYQAFSDCSNLTYIKLSDNLNDIGDEAFSGCNGLTFITLPNNLKFIGNYAFSGCSGLTSIAMPDSVITIGDGAFAYCWGLTSIILSNSLTAIGNQAFSMDSNLTTITLPDSITEIGSNPFSGCGKLREIHVSANHPTLATIDGVLFRKREKQLVCYPAGKENSSYDVPKGIRVIGDSAFYGCYNLNSVSLPDTVTTIENGAFYSCTGLTSMTLPNSITDIGANPFASCDNLKSIMVSPEHPTLATIDDVLFYKPEKRLVCYPATKEDSSYAVPQGIRVIGDSAFNRCLNLNSIFLPDSVMSIGNKAFFYCNNLSSITLPVGLTVIGDSLFALCEKLTSITLPDSLQIIEATAFFGCDSLHSITVPEGVKAIGEMAFANCERLTSVTLPSSLTTIGDRAFEYYDSRIVFTVTRGSYAEQYCKDNRKEYTYLNSSDTDDNFGSDATMAANGAEMTDGYSRVLPDGDYLIACAADTSYYLDIDGTDLSAANGANVAIWNLEGKQPNQCDIWTITYHDGFYTIRQKGTDMYLDVAEDNGSMLASNTNVQVWAGNFATNQQWAISQNGSAYRIQARCSGFSLDLMDATLENGSNVIQLPNNDSEMQKWSFIPYDSAHFPDAEQFSIYREGKIITVLNKEFEDYVFGNPAMDNNIDEELAFYLCALAFSTYEKEDIYNSLKSLGFTKIDPSVEYSMTEQHKAAFALGKKQISDDRALVFISVRGTYDNWDKVTDAGLGFWTTLFNGKHEGFMTSAKNIIEQLKIFLETDNLADKSITYIITGHSLGAGVANLLALELTDNEIGVERNNVYNYNFATPNVANKNYRDFNPNGMHNNIKNICNSADVVPYLPGSIKDTKATLIDIKFYESTGIKLGLSDVQKISEISHWDKFGISVWFTVVPEAENLLDKMSKWIEITHMETSYLYCFASGIMNIDSEADIVNVPERTIILYNELEQEENQTDQIEPGEYTSGDYTYRLFENGEVQIVRYNGHDSTVTVPATLDGHPVTAIGDNAFFYHSGKYGINSITLPDGITSIGNYAFSDCYINSITLPSNLKTLGDGAFSSCWPLTSVTLPDSITEIGANPFYDCLSLESIRVSSSHPTLATIDGVLFYKPEKRLVCYPVSIKNSSYTVPQGIRVIGDNAFCNNYLKSITLPDSVTVIGKEAFSACGNLITVTFSDSVTAIGDNAFPNSPYLTVTVPNESYGELYCKENHLSYKTYGSEATPTEDPISFHFKDDARQWYEPMVTFPVGYIEIYTNGNINDVKIVGCELSDESNIILAYYEEPANVEGDHLYHQFGISSIPDYAGIHYTLLPGANYKFREYVIYNGKKYYNGWIYFKMRDWLINGQ